MSEPESGNPHEVIDLTNLDSDSESEGPFGDLDVAPLSEEDHAQLHTAIASLDHTLLRQLVADLVDEEPYIARALYDRLASDGQSSSGDEEPEVAQTAQAPALPPPPPQPPTPPSTSGDNLAGAEDPGSSSVGEEDAEPPPSASSEPVPVPTLETCVNCDVDFDAGADRHDGECIYHPGRLDVDEEKFVDWDEGPHGPMDTEENRRRFPENFTWTCCKGDGRSEGCREGTHASGGSNKKRARVI